MIDRDLKRSLGQLINGVQVVGSAARGVQRAYCSHWVMQVAFEEPIVLVSVSPKHDTHGLIVESGRFAVSVLAADQVAQGQYFSYPGRRFRYLADEYVEEWLGLPVVPDAISYLACEWFERKPGRRPRPVLRPRRGRARRSTQGAAAAVLIAPRMAADGRGRP